MCLCLLALPCVSEPGFVKTSAIFMNFKNQNNCKIALERYGFLSKIELNLY